MQASSRAHTARLLALASAAALLGGCSSVGNVLSNDKVDYKASQANQGVKLEVPPDLTQLTRETRYQTTGGTVSASTLQQTQPGALTSTPSARPVAPIASGDVRIERAGSQRWLVSTLPPETVWTQLRAFWQEQGFSLTTDDQGSGVMETNWSENRAKLKTDVIRNAIGSVFDSLYDTGERDRFRTRIERTAAGGTEVYISHRGLQEVYTSAQKDQTTWRARAADPDLEAEFLGRLLVKLGAKPEAAKAAVAEAPQAAAKARLVAGTATPTVQVDDGFDAAWRRVGLALDRSGFTVEDRDRAQGTYFVRYVDPTKDRKNDGGFLSRIFGGSDTTKLARYRINVKSADKGTVVTVLDEKGQAENSDTTKRIAGLLVDELK